MQICARQGLTLNQFFELSDTEQEYWLAYEVDRLERFNTFTKSLEGKDTIQVIVHSLLQLVKDGIM